MDLRDFLRTLRMRWWIVLAATIVATGVGGLVTGLTQARYATTTTFFVTTANQGVAEAYQGGLFSQQRVKSYADLLGSDRLAQAVTQHGVGLGPAQTKALISARAVPNTVLLQATVTDVSPARSQAVAVAVAEEFAKLVESLETPPGGQEPSVKVEVVSGPALDPTPVSPRPLRNYALGGLLGLVVGILVAVLRQALDTKIRTGEILREQTGAPLLGAIPFEAAAKKAPLILDWDARSTRAEAFRQLRTNLQFVDVDRTGQVVVVTSSVPDEGKSATTVNLAIAFAEAGKRVLLIDADMRRPKIAEHLGIEGAVGLSNVLAGQVGAEDVLQRWGRHELSVLPTGAIPPNPSELLGSQRMVELLAQMRERFDTVLIDTPPLLPVTDAAVTAARADGAILIVRAGRTSRTQVQAGRRALDTVDARLLGCVISMVSRAQEGYYYYRAEQRKAVPRHASSQAQPSPSPQPETATVPQVQPETVPANAAASESAAAQVRSA